MQEVRRRGHERPIQTGSGCGGYYGGHLCPGIWTQLGDELRKPRGRILWAGTFGILFNGGDLGAALFVASGFDCFCDQDCVNLGDCCPDSSPRRERRGLARPGPGTNR